MKVRLTILTENDKPIPDVDIEILKEKVKCAWQIIMSGVMLFNSENESAIVENVEIVKEDGGGAAARYHFPEDVDGQ